MRAHVYLLQENGNYKVDREKAPAHPKDQKRNGDKESFGGFRHEKSPYGAFETVRRRPNMIPQQKEVSLEEFLSSPEYKRCEFEDGMVTEKAMPDWDHSILAVWIGSLILRYFPQFAAAADLRSRLNPDRWRLPDVSVAPWSDTRLTKYAEKPLYLCTFLPTSNQ